MSDGAAPTVRSAGVDDAGAIADLVGQLGYPASGDQVRHRLTRLLGRADLAVLVATDATGVIGMATFHLIPVVHEDAPRGQLTALVVTREARRRGVGADLVRHVEKLAAERGVRRLVVTTANRRLETHAFYERLGFDWTGRRYAKELDEG